MADRWHGEVIATPDADMPWKIVVYHSNSDVHSETPCRTRSEGYAALADIISGLEEALTH